MKNTKIKLLILTMIVGIMTFVGCSSTTTSDEKQQTKQEEILQQATDQLGMPNITNFQEKKLMKQIMELCDKSDLVCYAYSFSEYTGKYNYIGQCIGFGLPYGTEYTNPEKVEWQHSSLVNLPQADPNGLFKASNVSATWVCMIDESTGERYVMYNEPNITISAHKLPKAILNSIPDNY